MNATDLMMDAMGIIQHHDAVTGTAKQAVANDYNYKLFRALEANNQVFAQVISEQVQALTGLQPNGQFEWCFRENTTYLDCPISQHNSTNETFTMHVAAYNPSTDATNYVSIAVPHGNFKVQQFDLSAAPGKGTFVDSVADVICDNDLMVNNTIYNCWLYVEYNIPPMATGVVSLKYDKTIDLIAYP